MSKANRQASQRTPTPAWLWLALIPGAALIFWQYVPRRDRPATRPAQTSWLWVIAPFLASIFAVLALVAFQFLRSFDWGVRRAQKRAQAGDIDGAIEDLREQIEDKGPTQTRVNALGILLLNRERWAEAAALFRKGEEIGEFKGACKANLGLALLKGGNPAEALPVLEEAAHVSARFPVMICLIGLNTALALAELNRWDEAQEQFRMAERIAGRLRKAHRAVLNLQIEQCRRKLEQQPRDEPKPEGIAEL
jgi:tetratricopeptide (TPR) repeat protein